MFKQRNWLAWACTHEDTWSEGELPMVMPDPWADAEIIAQQLGEPGAELLVVLGAAAWCQRCRELQRAFELLAPTLPAQVLPMWLDLEEHAEFLADFIPPDLPLLLRWREGICIQAAVVQHIEPGATEASERVKLQPLVVQAGGLLDPADGSPLALPALWRLFSAVGWAQG
jgi:hypothetical protein